MNHRLQNWASLLDALIEQRRCMPFAWGTHDCCQFARVAVKAMTGSDPAAKWGLRRYKSARGAVNNLNRLGGLEALPAKAGLQEIMLAYAGRGDVLVCDIEGRPALAICLGAVCVGPGATGLVFQKTSDAQSAWKV